MFFSKIKRLREILSEVERDSVRNGVHLLARAAVRYQVVEAYREEYPISVLCDTLGVSLSGYYAWKKRPVSKHRQEDSQLTEYIQEAYRVGRKVYGSPRIHAELRARGISCSRKRVARLMKDQGLSA
jgi:putative transposase